MITTVIEYVKQADFSFKILTSNDHDILDEALSWHYIRYGYEVDKSKEKQIYKSFLNDNGNYDSCLIACFDANGNIVAVNSHTVWKITPWWTFGRLTIKQDNGYQGPMTKNQLLIAKKLVEFNCKLAEDNYRYDWWVVSLDSRKSKMQRNLIFLDDVYKRYNESIAHIYQPGESTTWTMFKNIFDSEKNPHKKPLILRQFSLKNEYRYLFDK